MVSQPRETAYFVFSLKDAIVPVLEKGIADAKQLYQESMKINKLIDNLGLIMPATLNDHNLMLDRRSDLIVMHSDGLTARWDLQKYPGIFQHHGMIICAVLYKDFDRNNDDSTIMVAKFDK